MHKRAVTNIRYVALPLFALLLGGGQSVAQVTFPISFDASAAALTEPERTQLALHFQEAGRRWAQVLQVSGARSIEIEVRVDNAAPRFTCGSATSAFVEMIGGRNTFEQGSAHEMRTGEDSNGPAPDVRVSVNTGYLRDEIWFDPDPVARSASVPNNRTDGLSVALHELGHALAFNGWANGQGNAPATYWSTFDRWMLAGAPTLFDGPEVLQAWGSRPELTTDNIHHWANGPAPPPPVRAKRVLWRDGVPVPMLTCEGLPSADAPASRDGLFKGSLPPDLVYQLMNGVVFYRGVRYDIAALEIAALADAGLPTKEPPLFANGFE